MAANAKRPPKRPLRFWQKSYLATLALFLVCLFGGVFGVTAISRQVSFDSRSQEFLTRQHLAAQTLAEDISAVSASRPAALPDLYAYYGEQYRRDGLLLAVWNDGQCLYTAQPGGETVSAAETAALGAISPGQRSWQVRLVAGRHIIFAVTALSGELSGYGIGACADLEDFYAGWQRTELLFLGLAAGVSLIFALGLFLVLERMNRPLRQLSATAEALAAGDFGVRAPTARHDELGELGQTLNAMASQVQAQMSQLLAEAEAKQQLVDNLSHEMRTPLTAIGGYADYMRRAKLNQRELAEAADTIGFESKRLLSLSEQLVRLSALAHDAPELALLDPAPLLRRTAEAAAPKAAERGVTVCLALGGTESKPLPPILGNAALLESLFLNLVDNGVKACRAGGTVTLDAAPGPGGGCRVTVTDTGCGMSAETLAHIGQPFYRADKARSRAEGGAGLGVALCKSIVNTHHARLTYESTPALGTAAAVEFPPCALPTQD